MKHDIVSIKFNINIGKICVPNHEPTHAIEITTIHIINMNTFNTYKIIHTLNSEQGWTPRHINNSASANAF